MPIGALKDESDLKRWLERQLANAPGNGQGGGGLVAAPPSGAASGVLSGFYPSPGFAVDMATQAELNAAISGLSATYQPLDSDLTAIAAVSTTAYGRAVLALADAAALRTYGALAGTGVANTFTLPQIIDLAASGTALTLDTHSGGSGNPWVALTEAGSARGSIYEATNKVVLEGASGLTLKASAGDLTVQSVIGDILLSSASGVVGVGGAVLGSVGDATAATDAVNRQFGDARYQALDSDLTAIAALSTTSYGRALLALADAAAARTYIGAAASSHTHAKADLPAAIAYEDEANTFTLGQIVDLAAAGTAFTADVTASGDKFVSFKVNGSEKGYIDWDGSINGVEIVGNSGLYLGEVGSGKIVLQNNADIKLDAGGDIDAASNLIKNLSDPVSAQDAVTKSWMLANTVASYSGLTGIPAAIDAIDGLTPAADKLAYYTGASSAALADFTAFGRSLAGAANAAAVEALGVAPIASPDFTGSPTAPHPSFGIGSTQIATTQWVFDNTFSAAVIDAKGDLLLGSADNTLDNLTVGANDTMLMADSGQTLGVKWGTPSQVRTALGLVIGTNVQAYDAELAALAGLTSAADKGIQFTGAGTAATYDLTTAGKALLDDADATAQRATLGLVIGTNVQAYDAELAALAGLTSAADKGIQFTGAGTAGTYDLTAAGKALLDDADAAAQRATLGLVIGTNVQAYDAELAALAGLTSAANKLPYFSGSGTAALADLTAFGRSLIDDADAAAARTTLQLTAGDGISFSIPGYSNTISVATDVMRGTIGDAKGDLIGFSADNTPAKLSGAGIADNYVLTRVDAETTGLKWQDSGAIVRAKEVFHAYRATNTSALASGAIIVYASEHSDPSSMFDTSTGRATIQRTGYYTFEASALLAESFATWATIGIHKNGSIVKWGASGNGTSAANSDIFTVSTPPILCVAGDVIDVRGSWTGTKTVYGEAVGQFSYFGGELVSADYAGSLTTPKFAAYRLNSGHTVATGDRVQFDAEDYDNGSGFDSTSTKGRFTAPVAGKYHFDWMVYAGAAITSGKTWAADLVLVSSGAKIKRGQIAVSNGTVLLMSGGGGDYTLAAGDQVEIRVTHDNGGTVTVNWGDTGTTYFSGHLIRDDAAVPTETVWTDYTPTLTGWSANPTNTSYRYTRTGKVVTVQINQRTTGTSNSGSTKVSLPYAARTTDSNAMHEGLVARAYNNGALISHAVLAQIDPADPTNIAFYIDPWSGATWTASGGKAILSYTFTYECA